MRGRFIAVAIVVAGAMIRPAGIVEGSTRGRIIDVTVDRVATANHRDQLIEETISRVSTMCKAHVGYCTNDRRWNDLGGSGSHDAMDTTEAERPDGGGFTGDLPQDQPLPYRSVGEGQPLWVLSNTASSTKNRADVGALAAGWVIEPMEAFSDPAVIAATYPVNDPSWNAAGDDWEPRRTSAIREAIKKLSTAFELSAGYRTDNLQFTIAGNIDGTSPNILSELTWRELRSFQIKLQGHGTFNEHAYWRSSYAHGWIVSGDNQDSDYLGDNRTLEFSRSNNNSEDGTVSDASVGLGYQFDFFEETLTLAPLGGYSRHWQGLTITDGLQTLGGTLGPFEGLASTYDATWTGWWTGMDFSYRSTDRLSLIGTFEYHWADYDAHANWNLRSDFRHPDSFHHFAEGNGVVASLGGTYDFSQQWSANANLDFQSWWTDPGTARTFFASGTTTDTQLNAVNWDSLAVMTGFAYAW